MPEYQHDKIVPFKESAVSKKEQVAEMFNRIAFRYDFLNRFLSGGIDRSWRKKAIIELKTVNPKTVLDLATGTADMPIMLMKLLSPDKVIGIDISEAMLELGRRKVEKNNLKGKISLQTGDAENIYFSNASFFAATVAFGVRNFQNLEKGLSEIYRILKPGGKLVILEFSKPDNSYFLPFYKLYLKVIAPRIGKMISGSLDAYTYLNDSVNAFPEGKAFIGILNKSGFKETYFKRLSLGICTIYCGNK
ncbi:MAG TPA: bifunctional demethylmenaquinone methyltransferase/2-methoxy-6-polyprenyl-1,4-benzoquinol methylase UbiE [Puia sp.]|nr:bifunctional demethylmenaquinone methyltransferase/2-methoxy-6-polyprenyl-1,4-benzoquinol methylase UbiE [Puia sp.]